MSTYTWHNYGYGIQFSGLGPYSVERIQALLKLAPEFEKTVQEWFDECEITEPTTDDYLDFDQDSYLGIGYLVGEVIAEAEGLRLTVCDDANSHIYLMYQPSYPWQISQDDLNITEEKLKEIITKYLRIITDKELDICYQEAENCG